MKIERIKANLAFEVLKSFLTVLFLYIVAVVVLVVANATMTKFEFDFEFYFALASGIALLSMILFPIFTLQDVIYNNRHLDEPPIEVSNNQFIIHYRKKKVTPLPMNKIAKIEQVDGKKKKFGTIQFVTFEGHGYTISYVANVDQAIAYLNQCLENFRDDAGKDGIDDAVTVDNQSDSE